jgi:hypothetical protein
MGQPDQSGFGLASLVVPGDPAQLEAEARYAMAELGGDAGGQPEGTDPTNSIWVTTDREGLVHSVEVSRQWRDRIEPGEFGNALFQAYSSANFKAVAAAARSDLTGDSGGGPGAATGEPVAELLDTSDWLTRMREVLEKAEQRVEAAERLQRQGGPASDEADRTVASPNGMLTLKLRAGALVAITSDIMSIRRADAEALRMEILDAFRDAGLIASH